MKQPDPVQNDNVPICDLVVEDLKQRKEVGMQRYGVALQANNGRNSALDLYEELLDAVQYCKQLVIENQQLKEENSYLNALVQNLEEGMYGDDI